MAHALGELLERERELCLLKDAFDGALEGSASVVLIKGDPGLGKSSLLDESAAIADRLGFTVLRARGGMLERTLGWGVARQLFEDSVVRAPASTRRSLLRGSAALASPVLGLVEARPREAADAGAGPLKDFRLEHGLYWLVCNLTERGPLALVLDDAQWCDDPALGWLLYLVRRSERLPLALVIATRTGEPEAPAALLDLIAAEPITHNVSLSPLSPRGTEALLEDAYGVAIDPEFGLACHGWTGGNPLFVKELAGELVAEGVEPVEASATRVRTLTPEAVSRVLLVRLARLSEPALALARALAVLESSARAQLAFELAGLGADAGTAALDELIAARVVRADPLGFLHPLIGAVIYGDIEPARRAMMHKRSARLLVEDRAEPGLIGAHLIRAAPAGEAWVVAELRRAAELERSRGSPSTAVALLRRAVSEPPDARSLDEVILELGRSELLAGDPSGIDTLRAALTACTDARERAEIALLLGRLSLWGGGAAQAVDVAKAAAEEIGWEDVDLRLQLEALVVNAARVDLKLVGLIPQRLSLAREKAKDDTYGSRLIAAQMAWGLTSVGAPADRCVRWARRALSDGRLVSESPSAPDAYLGAILMLAFADELEEADSCYAHAIALAQRNGSAPAFSGSSCFRAYTVYLSGRLDEAELLARDALRTSAEARGLVVAQGVATAILALALIGRGAVKEALETIADETPELERSQVPWSTVLLFASGLGSAASGRLDEAADSLLGCGRRAMAWGVVTPTWLPWRSEAALVLRALGRREEAVRLCEEELELARAVGARRSIGVALRACGLLDSEGAGIPLLRESCELLAASPARLEHARSLVALGQVLRRCNARADARAPLTEGLALAERCAASPLATEARTGLAAIGVRPRSVMRTGADALTVSERRVCELAASGKSNPEIAQLLFVTRATVESHLHSAYRRLDIASRKELAAALGSANP